jgi:hypothetical protein
MTLHISGECASSAVAFLDRVRQRLAREKTAADLIRAREIALLNEFRKNKPQVPVKIRSRCKPGESLHIAQAAKKMLDAGKSRAEINDALGIDDRLFRYHMEQNGLMPAAGKDYRFRRRCFTLTPAMIATCKKLRPHTTWDDIAAQLGVNRSTLINNYKAHLLHLARAK